MFRGLPVADVEWGAVGLSGPCARAIVDTIIDVVTNPLTRLDRQLEVFKQFRQNSRAAKVDLHYVDWAGTI